MTRHVRTHQHTTPATRNAAARVQAALSARPGTDTLPRVGAWCLSPCEPGQAPSQTTEPVPRHRFVWGFLASLSAVALSLYHPGMPSDVRAEDWKPTPREPEQGSDPRYPTGARDQDRWPWRSDRTADLSRNPDPKIRLAANEGSEGGPKQSFDIPAGNLETALIGFSRQSGIQLLYASDLVAGHETTGLRGDYVPEDALRLLLDKTGLQYRFSNPNAVTVQPAGRSEDVGPPTPATPQAETKPVKVPEIVVKEKKERALVVDQPDGYKADVSSEAVLRFPARIQELPMSVGVVTQDSMRERRAVTQTEALEGIAGISKTGQFSGPTADSYVIRGFTTDTEFPGYTRDNGLSAFNNYVGDPTLYERIEVIKGAASFTSGLVTAGGFVNRLLKAPEYRNFVAGEAGVGSHGHYRTTLDANGVMPNLPVAGRFVFSHNEDPEFFRNTGNQRFSFLPSVRFSPREDFTVTVTGNVQRLRGKGNFGTPTTTQGLIPAGIEDSFQGNDNRVKIDYHSLHIEADKKFVQGLRLKAKGQYSHSDSRYQYAYGYQRTDSLGGIGADGNFSIYGNAGHFKRESFAGEVNLTREFSLFGNPSSVAAGVDYSTSRRGFRLAEALDFGTGNIANPQINAPFPAGFIIDSPTSLSGTIRYSDIRYNQTGAFLQGLLRPFAGTTLMIALRGNWITQGSLEEEGTPFPEGPGNREGLNASRLTPQVGLSQRLTQGLNVYASYGESIQPNFALTRDGSLLEPITGRTVEIGSKWELLEKRLRFTAALFRTDLSNVATPDPADPIRFSIGGQSQRNQGFEFQAQGAPLPQLQVNLAYTFLEAEITKSTIPDVIGARPQNVPAHTVSVFGSYDFSELVTKGLKLGAVVLYRSEVHAFVPLQSEIFSGYTRADLFAIYAPLKWLSFQVNLNNIADARYIEGPISYGAYNTFGAPRHVIGMVRMTF